MKKEYTYIYEIKLVEDNDILKRCKISDNKIRINDLIMMETKKFNVEFKDIKLVNLKIIEQTFDEKVDKEKVLEMKKNELLEFEKYLINKNTELYFKEQLLIKDKEEFNNHLKEFENKIKEQLNKDEIKEVESLKDFSIKVNKDIQEQKDKINDDFMKNYLKDKLKDIEKSIKEDSLIPLDELNNKRKRDNHITRDEQDFQDLKDF